ncbi:MAG: magnesium transporter [Candidatus Izemoplasmatales bacterium]|jgi:magnesium transporter
MEETNLVGYEEEIKRILKSDISPSEKRTQLDEFHDVELARSLMVLSPSERDFFLTVFTGDQLGNIFAELPPESAVEFLRVTPAAPIREIFRGMQSDDLIDVLEGFTDPDERLTYLTLVNQKKRQEIMALLDFDENLVGSIMNNNYVEISKNDNVKNAIKKMVNQAPKVEFINNLYVIDNGYLVGALSLKEIIAAGNKPDELIQDVMTTNLVSLTPWTENEDAIELMKNYDFALLPVVNKDFKMLGVVAFDDIFEVLHIESDKDYSKLAGLTEIAIDENKETVFKSVGKRMPWLIILLFINLITSSIIAGFEDVLQLIPTLALFMPLILNLAGNTGTQSLGVVIRLFATNQLEDQAAIRKHLGKEFLTGVVNGIVIATLLFGMVVGMRMLQGNAFMEVVPFAGVIALSISVSFVVATMAGTLVPLTLNLLRVDPAVASGPFITTINDIISLIIYFGLASLLLASYL